MERSLEYKVAMAHQEFNHMKFASVEFCVLVYKISNELIFCIKTVVKYLSKCKFLSSKLPPSDNSGSRNLLHILGVKRMSNLLILVQYWEINNE